MKSQKIILSKYSQYLQFVQVLVLFFKNPNFLHQLNIPSVTQLTSTSFWIYKAVRENDPCSFLSSLVSSSEHSFIFSPYSYKTLNSVPERSLEFRGTRTIKWPLPIFLSPIYISYFLFQYFFESLTGLLLLSPQQLTQIKFSDLKQETSQRHVCSLIDSFPIYYIIDIL